MDEQAEQRHELCGKHLTDVIDPGDISLIMACSFQEFQRFIKITNIPFTSMSASGSCPAQLTKFRIPVSGSSSRAEIRRSADAFSVAFKRLHMSPGRQTDKREAEVLRLNFSYTIKASTN